MPGNAGEFGVGSSSLDREGIRVADATGFDADANVTGLGSTSGRSAISNFPRFVACTTR